MTNEEIRRRFADGQEQFVAIRETLVAINAKLERLPVMEKDMAATKEIVEAWNAVKVGGRFIRWIIPIVTALAAGWLYLKGFFK